MDVDVGHAAFTVVSPRMGTDGWPFASVDQFPDANADPLYDSRHVKDLYLRADPAYSGRFTVPVLWDKKRHTIVNNESSEIIRILNTEFDVLLPDDKAQLDFYPTQLRADIDALNEWVYDKINSAFVVGRLTGLLNIVAFRWGLYGWFCEEPRGISRRRRNSLRSS
jgi:glutathionyl-hydroquinone reductase